MFIFLFSVFPIFFFFFTSHKLQHTAVGPCLSYEYSRQKIISSEIALLTCLIKHNGHASESFRWILISPILESDIVLSGGHTLWKFYEIYITLCSQVDMLLRVFAEIYMSATVESHIVLSGGYALWKFPRHLFHSQISSGHPPLNCKLPHFVCEEGKVKLLREYLTERDA